MKQVTLIDTPIIECLNQAPGTTSMITSYINGVLPNKVENRRVLYRLKNLKKMGLIIEVNNSYKNQKSWSIPKRS